MGKHRANFLHRGKWWVAWTDDVPGAVTQGRTLAEARENLKDAISLMLEPADLDALPPASTEVIQEIVEV
jgi:predicted RNase H-like HicB family nuclease